MFDMLRRTRLPARVTCAVTLTLLGACGGVAETDISSTATIGHVHGLGVNPADGDLYVATHTGVFVIDRKIDRVGPTQDTMGFTIAGPDKFLGSGHPADLTGPASLGLIESTDRAKTWDPIAFDNTADFHAIDVSGRWTYAYASDQGLVRSDDKQSWATVAREPFFDIAANPQDPDRLLATTDTGELQSVAVGRRPATVPRSPIMGPIDYAGPFLVAALGPKGQVYVSRSGGETWTETADLPGDSEAVDASTAVWHAATSSGIYESTDEGITWTPVYETSK